MTVLLNAGDGRYEAAPGSPVAVVVRLLISEGAKHPDLVDWYWENVVQKAIDAQMKNGETVFIEALINQELGEPFRRDAMKAPNVVAGIDPADMRPQQGA